MTVLIKGLNMPKDCPMCYLSNWNNCAEFTGCKVVQGKLYAMTKDPEYANTNTRPDWCPLIEVKEHTYMLDTMDHIKEIAKKGLPAAVTAYEIKGRNYFKVEDDK